MEVQLLVSLLIACLLPTVYGESAAVAWCYHLPTCNDSHWSSLSPADCNGTRQSPINIVTTSVQPDGNLTAFSFTGFNESANLRSIINTGKTVKLETDSEKMFVSGGGLQEQYSTIELHFHWGNRSSSGRSEHTVDGKQFALELHIVNRKRSKNTTEALKDPTGLAVFAFLIEATSDKGKPESWKNLTSFMANISNQGDSLDITNQLTVDSLIEGVDRTKYYRYFGSLTSPACNEAVVWTVFKDPIKVSQDLIDLFSTTVHVEGSTTEFMVNNYRSIQPLNNRIITSQRSSASTHHYTLSISAALLASVLLCWV